MNIHQHGPATVLVVEDDALTRLRAVRAVEAQGYLSLSAGDADEALVTLEAHGAIDVLFTDVAMPGSMDGMDLATEARRLHPGMEIIIASGGRHPGERMPIRALFLTKPYGDEQVGDILRETIDQTRPFVC